MKLICVIISVIISLVRMDLLVKWDKGGSNIVSSEDIQLVGGNRLEKGVRVKMLWTDSKRSAQWWMGTVELVEEKEEEMDTNTQQDNTSDHDRLVIFR
jgi:hypothetical protein